MLDSSVIVQSAASSFNNMALRSPDFFWTAILCIPIFMVAWIFRTQIRDKFKLSDGMVAGLTLACVAILTLARQNFEVLRQSFSWTGIVVAICLFLCSLFLAGKYYSGKTRLSGLLKKSKFIDWFVPPLITVVAGLCALPNLKMAFVQMGAVVLGLVLGWSRRRSFGSQTITVMVMFLLTLAMATQPEFLRFGQLGQLTVVHLVFLTAAAVLFPMYFALRMVKPSGFLNNSWHRKFKLLGWLCGVLVFALYLMTESELIFVALALVSFVYFAESVRHLPMSSGDKIVELRNNVWSVLLVLFGVLGAVPLVAALGVLMYKPVPKKTVMEFL